MKKIILKEYLKLIWYQFKEYVLPIAEFIAIYKVLME